MKKIKISKLITEKIKTDNQFSLEVAKRLDRTQQAVILMAKSFSASLLHYNLVLFYKEQGFSEEQIFDNPMKQ